jgi:hypothetical protein
MIIKHVWSILCKESVINQDDNVMSLLGVLEAINSQLTPINPTKEKPEKIIIPFNFELTSYWIKEDEGEAKLDIKVEIIDPQGKQLGEIVNNNVIPQNNPRFRTRLKIQGLPVTSNGRYYFVVSSKDNSSSKYSKHAEIPLDVTLKITEPNQKINQ